MNVSVEGFTALQGLSCFCALWTLTRRTNVTRPPLLRMVLSALGGGMCVTLCAMWGGMLPRLAGSALLLLLPRSVLPRLPLRYALRLHGSFLLLSLLTDGLARGCMGLGLPPVYAVIVGCVSLLTLPGLRNPPLDVTRVEIRRGGCTATLSAMVDSGNLLRDAITGLPVIVCSPKALAALIPPIHAGTLPLGFRYLNARTASGTALLPCFRPERVRLRSQHGFYEVQALVALAVNGYSGFQALIPAVLTRDDTPRRVPHVGSPTA